MIQIERTPGIVTNDLGRSYVRSVICREQSGYAVHVIHGMGNWRPHVPVGHEYRRRGIATLAQAREAAAQMERALASRYPQYPTSTPERDGEFGPTLEAVRWDVERFTRRAEAGEEGAARRLAETEAQYGYALS